MWLELGNIWLNTDHLVRVEFVTTNNALTATLITTKPGGSDRTFMTGEDAQKLKTFFEDTKKPQIQFVGGGTDGVLPL